ncbi:MAG: hypothetical protein SF028_07695 [Candidatus Sumerlaeia bacterium]|nr:hypothetical protein [Candidatus Sumerlaeia bacterium]
MKHATILALFAIAAPLAAQNQPPPSALGQPFADPVVGFYVPPTRSDQPLAATASAVSVWEKDGARWKTIMDAEGTGRRILGLGGYPKSSKALYVAHTEGVSYSRDAGASWEEGRPAGWEDAGEFVAIAVNPTERKQAIVATRTRLWLTMLNGRFWQDMPRPSPREEVRFLSFTGGDQPILVLGTSQALYQSTNTGDTWTALYRTENGPRAVAVSPEKPIAAIVDETGQLVLFDLARPGYRLTRTVTGGPLAGGIAFSDSGTLWLASDAGVVAALAGEASPSLLPVAALAAPARFIVPNPRLASGAYWVSGNAVYRFDDGPVGLFNVQKFEQGIPLAAATAEPDAANREGGLEEADAILARVMAGEPPIEEVIAASLRTAEIRPRDVERWKRNVRRRNLIPEVAFRTGSSEEALNRTTIVRETNRFDEQSYNDLYEDDEVRWMDSYFVEFRWDLKNLVMDDEEVAISEEARRAAEQRNKVVTDVSKLYYERIGMLVREEMEAGAMSTEEAIRFRLRLSEATSLLNEICGEGLYTSTP